MVTRKGKFQISIIVSVEGKALEDFFELDEDVRYQLREQARLNLLGKDQNKAFSDLRAGKRWRNSLDLGNSSWMPETREVRLKRDAAIEAFGESNFRTQISPSQHHHALPAQPTAQDYVDVAQGYTCVRYEIIDGHVVAIYNTKLLAEYNGSPVKPFDGSGATIDADYHMVLSIVRETEVSAPEPDPGYAPCSSGIAVDMWHHDIESFETLLDGERFDLNSEALGNLLAGVSPREWSWFWSDFGTIKTDKSGLPIPADVQDELAKQVDRYNHDNRFNILYLKLRPDYKPPPKAIEALLPLQDFLAPGDFLSKVLLRMQLLTTLRFEVVDMDPVATYYIAAAGFAKKTVTPVPIPKEPLSKETVERYGCRALYLAALRIRA